MRSFFWLTACFCTFSAFAAAEEKGDRRCLELKVGETKYQGRQLYSDDEVCWLLEKTVGCAISNGPGDGLPSGQQCLQALQPE